MKTFFCNRTVDKNEMKRLIKWVLLTYGTTKTTHLVDQLKTMGFHYATAAGISLGIDDLRVPPVKAAFMDNAENEIYENEIRFQRGQSTAVERLEKALDIWNTTNDSLKSEVIAHFRETDIFNPVYMMAFSGARGNISQVRQLVGMRGLMADPQGQIIEFPIRRNFREGLTVTEYMISCYGARKGLVDTALRTASSGYLTRRLVDVAQSVIIQQLDCGTSSGLPVKPNPKTIESSLVGRVLAERIVDTQTGKIIGQKNQTITPRLATKLQHRASVRVRSPLTCHFHSVCQLCYGWSLADQKLVQLGDAVGVLAAQSIGEPGTQLTMRTFHTGGVFAGEVTEKVYAPHAGIIFYSEKPRGRKVNSRYGETAFLTYQRIKLKIVNGDHKSILEFPPLTLLFVAPGQPIFFHQTLAEVSRVETSTSQSTTLVTDQHDESGAISDRSSKEFLSTLDGQIYFSTLPETVKHTKAAKWYNGRDVLMWILAGTLIKQPTKIEEIETTIEKRPGDCYITAFYPTVNSTQEKHAFQQSKQESGQVLVERKYTTLQKIEYWGPRQKYTEGFIQKTKSDLAKTESWVSNPLQTTKANFGLGSGMTTKSRPKHTKYGAQYEGLLTSPHQPENMVGLKTLHEQKQESESITGNSMLSKCMSGTYVTLGKKLICRGLYAQHKKFALEKLMVPPSVQITQPTTHLSYQPACKPTQMAAAKRTLFPFDLKRHVPVDTKAPGEIRVSTLMLTETDQQVFYVKNKTVCVNVGDFIRVDDLVTTTHRSPVSGQIIFLSENYIVIRHVQPYPLPNRIVTELKVKDGDLIKKNSVLGRLQFEQSDAGDIVQGLPKIDELLEAREPVEKRFSGIHFQLACYWRKYLRVYGPTQGCTRSFEQLRALIVNEIQDVYQSQGVYIADKHVEIIVRQMTTRVIILHPGSTGLLSGDMIDMYRAQHLSLDDPQLKFRPVLLGITRAALTSESFISAASFQETKRVLANAAITGQIDWLTGLKENVILGRLIPAGTGLY